MQLLMTYHELDADGQERLASGKGLSQVTARRLIDAEWATDYAKERAARKAGGNALLRWLGNSDLAQCSTEDGSRLMSDWHSWATGKIIPLRLKRTLIDKRPDLHPAIIAGGPRHGLFALTLASRHFSDQALVEQAIAQIRAVAAHCKATCDVAQRAGPVPNPTSAARVRTAERLMLKCERMTADLVANPAVSPELATAAVEMIATHTRRSLGNVAKLALLQRCKPLSGGYDRMAGALVEPYDQISDEATIGYLLDGLKTYNDGLALADLARNPHLGKHAGALAKRLGSGLYWDLSAREAHEVIVTFEANWPGCRVERLFDPPIAHAGPETHPVPIASYLVGDLSADRYRKPQRGNPVVTMPAHYPVALSLIGLVSREVRSGVALYVAKRLGTNAMAWVTFFALADELATSDLDTLCDTALALSE
jgi:hypothetical protein